MLPKRLNSILVLSIAAGTIFTYGCATKKYVRQRVDERVAPLENRTGELEETARRNSADIARLNSEVADARSRADRAQTSADRAQNTAENAQASASEATTRAERVSQRVDSIVENIDAYSLQRTVTVTFRLNSDRLSDEAIADLDALAADLQNKKGYVLDIQGYTDATGGTMKNRALSDRRARAVYQYLAERGVPLFRMNLLGFGEGQPVADNTTRDGRAQNRRVEVRVMTTSLEN